WRTATHGVRFLSVASKRSSPPQPERHAALSERLLRTPLRSAAALPIEAEREHRSSAVRVGDGDAAAVVVDGLLDDHEPEPRAGQRASRSGPVDAGEDV